MATDLADLIVARSATTLETELLTELTAEGFPVADWQPGSVPRSLVKGDAAALADLDTTVASLAGAAFLGTAEGLDGADEDAEASWLDLAAEEHFSEARIAATFAEWTLTLTAGSGIGPYNVGTGALSVAASNGRRFQSTNTGTVTVPLGGSVSITVKAERKGTGGNTATPSVIVSPALPGVTITAATLATSARDRETDDALIQRCRDKWPTLAEGQGPQAAYRYWLTSAVDSSGVSCGITKVAFGTIPGTGAVPIWVSGSSGNITAPQLVAAQDYVDVRKPLTDTPTLSHATEQDVDVSTMTVRFKTGQNTSANQTAVRDAIEATVNALDISTVDAPVTVDEAAIKAAVYSGAPSKVADVDWAGTDVTLAAGRVAVPAGTGSITFSG